MVFTFLAIVFIIAFLLPLEIRFAKLAYRNIVLVWFSEVQRAWNS